MKKKYTFNKKQNCYIGKWGIEILVSKKTIKERLESKIKLLKDYILPTKIICAGTGRLKNQRKKLIPLIKNKYEYIEIPKASHNFCEEWVEEQLFKETLKRLKKF